MSNSYFQFKQFKVEQDKCAMKVSTDACIQGAWTPIDDSVKKILDIGTGTGLLSLMLAQRNGLAMIDAIEIDEQAAIQAKENIATSPWYDRINVIQADATLHTFSNKHDLVICNPPFFQNSLLGPSEERNRARHTLSLSYEDMFTIFEKCLNTGGRASIMLPYTEHKQWEALLKSRGWYIIHRLLIQAKQNTHTIRVVSICSRNNNSSNDETLAVRKNASEYTDEFNQLLAPFYLHL